MSCLSVTTLRFAHREATRGEHFHGGDDHGDAPLGMSYYVWVVRGGHAPVVIDTGFTASVARRRNRPRLADPVALLDRAGVGPDEVRDVVLTHLHYDHVGNVAAFPRARFWIQQREWDFWRGPLARRSAYARLVERADLSLLGRLERKGRLVLVDGDASVDEGLSLHLVGGHSPGLQVVRVALADGPLVLAGDAAHYLENLVTDRPYAIVHDLADMYAAFDRVLDLAGSADRVLPGHDPDMPTITATVADADAFDGATATTR